MSIIAENTGCSELISAMPREESASSTSMLPGLMSNMARAALGCTVEAPTIHGTSKLEIPAGAQSGDRFTLHGQGIPSLRGGRKGDMVVEIQVRTPTRMTKEQKELLQRFAELEKPHEEEGGFFSWLFGHLGHKHKGGKDAGEERAAS